MTSQLKALFDLIWFDNLFYLKGISFFTWIDVPEVMNNVQSASDYSKTAK